MNEMNEINVIVPPGEILFAVGIWFPIDWISVDLASLERPQMLVMLGKTCRLWTEAEGKYALF